MSLAIRIVRPLAAVVGALALAACSTPAPTGTSAGPVPAAPSTPATTAAAGVRTATAASAADIVPGPRLGISDLGWTFVVPQGSVNGLDLSGAEIPDGTSLPALEWLTAAPAFRATDGSAISIIVPTVLSQEEPPDEELLRIVSQAMSKTIGSLERHTTAVGEAFVVTFADDAHVDDWEIVLYEPTAQAQVTFGGKTSNPEVGRATRELLLSSLAAG